MSSGTKPTPGILTVHIAATIRSELARQNMTKTLLSEQAGISLPQISRIVAGKKQCDIEELDRICHTLGLDMQTVLRDADNATQERHLVS